MTRLICMDAPEDMNPKPERLYMYAPNCWSANPFIAIQFHVEGAARDFGDLCHCHEGDYIWDADTEETIFRWGVVKDYIRDRKTKVESND